MGKKPIEIKDLPLDMSSYSDATLKEIEELAAGVFACVRQAWPDHGGFSFFSRGREANQHTVFTQSFPSGSNTIHVCAVAFALRGGLHSKGRLQLTRLLTSLNELARACERLVL